MIREEGEDIAEQARDRWGRGPTDKQDSGPTDKRDSGAEPQRRALILTRPAAFLTLVLLSCVAVGLAIFWLLHSARI